MGGTKQLRVPLRGSEGIWGLAVPWGGEAPQLLGFREEQDDALSLGLWFPASLQAATSGT